MEFQVILRALKSLGLGVGLRVSQYSFTRDLLDKSGNKKKSEIFREPGIKLSTQDLFNGIINEYQYATQTIRFLAHDLVCISWKPGKTPKPYTIVKPDWPPVEVKCTTHNLGKLLTSSKIQLVVRNDGGIKFCDVEGKILRDDQPPRQDGHAWQVTTNIRSDEHIYGLGERAAPFNLVGQTLRSWNTDPGGSYGPGKDPIYICTPVYMSLGSTGSYLIYFENSFPATFSFDQPATIEFCGGELRYYFFIGPPNVLLERYTELTGRPDLPPRWALGYHQSRWGYQTDDEIRNVVEGFVKHNLPISAIHLDIDYMDGYRIFTVDQSRFPNLRKLSDDLKSIGIRLVTIIDPAVKKDTLYHQYNDGLSKNVFCKTRQNKILHGVVWPGWAAYPDFTDPIAREWWGEQYQGLIDANISGFWHDMNEPVSFSAWGDTTLPVTTKHNLDGNPGDHLEAHNLYALLMNKAGYDAIRKLRPDQRPWLISRSGWAGLQRYAWNWTGDVASTWGALRQTLVILLGLSLSGHLFSGGDIGGFSGNPPAELYVRWFQLSTFFPFFRTHSANGTSPREPWSFGEPYTSIIRNFLNLRYKLIPYIYSLAWQANQTGAPLIRPIFWLFPEWVSSWNISDQFFLGEDLLVAPVLDSGAEYRDIQIPPGRWYLYWDDTIYKGPDTIRIKTDLSTIPIFIRAGCIFPIENKGNLELHIYVSENHSGSSLLYSDAGDGYGEARIDQFEYQWIIDIQNISWKTSGDYPLTYSNVTLIFHGGRVIKAWIDDHEILLVGSRIEAGKFTSAKFQFSSFNE
jgi:alpha-glucosidase